MARARWQQLEELFHAMLELPAERRDAALAAACGEDAELRSDVERLLHADGEASAFVGEAAAGLRRVAATVLPESGHIGPYRIVRELGRGGMGTVFLGERDDAQFKMRAAIKLIKRGMDSDAVLERFRHERQILAGLEHPNIARLLDGGTSSEGLPYFVMEYVDGLPVDEYCQTHRLSIEERLQLFLAICAAVTYAHQHLVVHRDIKPSNILVTSDRVPKLLDFGIAKLVEATDDATPVETAFGARAMTPQYASPEQLRGERVTTVSDVYALGVLLFELLAGERPYEVAGKSADEVREIVANTEAAKPSAVAARRDDPAAAARLRGDLDAIVLTAMRREPTERYGSAALLAEDVRRHLTARPVVARGDSVTYRAARFVRRRKLGVAAAAAIVLSLIGGVITTSWQARVAGAERARAERRFADVRRLSTSFLFDFHDAIATLPGSTPARLLVVSKALEYLDSLASEAGDDRELQKELAAAYDRVGDVQGNPGAANLGDIDGAIASYRKAEAIRRSLAAGAPDSLPARLDMATSTMRIGYADFARGAVKDAVAKFRDALAIREEAYQAGVPSPSAARAALAETTARLCTTLIPIGDLPGAIASCRHNLSLTEELLRERPDDHLILVMHAVNATGLGNALRLNRQPDEAAATLEEAIGRHQALLARNPLDAEVRRRLAVSHAYLANVHIDRKQPEQASESFGRAIAELDALAKADPANARIRTELSYMLNQRVRILVASGRTADARTDAQRALVLLRTGTEQPGAGGEALNEYAWALVSTEVEDIRNPRLALDYATRAIERAGSPNPVYLHTLGWAHYRLGHTAEAVQTLEQALRTLPAATAGPSVGLRRQIEADLATFKAAPDAR
jgi:tetratricopeptide (TPR) repeat protein/tRNA A-37 threonylcarbamoyl transferase component Bud32